MNKNPEVTILLDSGEKIKLELYPENAPNTVNNFIHLVETEYYDGVIFHRIIRDFMIQGGCPKGDGTGGPGYAIKGEFDGNGVENKLNHARGVISMARTMDPNSAGSQFFIMHKDSPHLDGQYAAFGKVIEGMEVVDRVACSSTTFNDKPKDNIVMEKVIVETHGVKYPQPEKM